MIGYVLSALITVTVERASSYVLLPVGLECGLDNSDLSRLKANLALAFAVLAKALRLPVNDENFTRLLVRLKGVIYDADDFLGGLEYRKREQMSLSSKFLGCLVKREEIVADELRRILENLEIITCNLKGIVEIHGSQHCGKQVDASRARFKPETSSLLPRHVFGREQEKETMIQLLMNQGNGSGGNASVVSILGPAGVGKTTVSQIIINDPRIKSHFDIRMWVHTACEPFDVSEVLKQIIELLPGKRHSADLTSLGNLQRLVMEELRSKRFLLVLDDMWNEDKSTLDNLIAPLRGLPGSVVLVTTQSKRVADAMEATDSIVLDGLPDESILSVFETAAFEYRKSENHLGLKAIGEKMVGKFMGSPLAAKTLGNKLNCNSNETCWRNVKDTELCRLPQDENDVLQVMRPSYSRLPPHLQQCVSFCSLYPKDHVFDEESLVQMWIAHDYVRPEGTMRIEDVGSRYVKDLTDRYFFLEQHNGGYSMQPLLHQVARYVSKDEFWAIEGGNSQLAIPDTVRHVSVSDPNVEVSQFIDICKDKNLRSILFLGNVPSDLGHALGKLKGVSSSVRVLVLGRCQIEKLPDSICKWTQLQYLDASSTEIRSLSKSFWRLDKLRVLKVPKCCVLHLPKGSKQTKLRYLEAGNDYVSRIKNIGRLTSLQELGEYTVLKERMRTIGELEDMNELRRSLHISKLENVGGFEEASQAQLNNKRHIDELILEWGSNRQCRKGIDDEHDAKVLEGLQPHPNLRVLEINSYVGLTSPVWLKDKLLPNLEKVSFRNCPNLQSLPSELPMISTLKSLTIENCPELKSLPEDGLPKSLVSFHLRNCPYLKERCRDDRSADWHKIAHITSLHFDG